MVRLRLNFNVAQARQKALPELFSLLRSIWLFLINFLFKPLFQAVSHRGPCLPRRTVKCNYPQPVACLVQLSTTTNIQFLYCISEMTTRWYLLPCEPGLKLRPALASFFFSSKSQMDKRQILLAVFSSVPFHSPLPSAWFLPDMRFICSIKEVMGYLPRVFEKSECRWKASLQIHGEVGERRTVQIGKYNDSCLSIRVELNESLPIWVFFTLSSAHLNPCHML